MTTVGLAANVLCIEYIFEILVVIQRPIQYCYKARLFQFRYFWWGLLFVFHIIWQQVLLLW